MTTKFTKLLVASAAALAIAGCGSTAQEVVEDAQQTVSSVASETSLPEASEFRTQLEASAGDADLTSLYSTLDVVGFDEIAPDEPFTFFAPNDSAFSTLDADALTQLLGNPDQLRGVLEDHLVTQRITAAELSDGTVESVGGLTLTIDTSGDTPTVNGIPIVRTDIEVENGVVHVIDGVLLEE